MNQHKFTMVSIFAAVLLVAAATAVMQTPQTPLDSSDENPTTIVKKASWLERVNNISRLNGKADLVVRGTVTDISDAQWNTATGEEPASIDRDHTIYRTVTVDVTDTLREENVPETAEIRVEGGTVGEKTVHVTSAPQFTIGEDTVLFLQEIDSEYGDYRVASMKHGKLQVEDDIVVRDHVPPAYWQEFTLDQLAERVQ